jgi:hypothetical protein
MNTNARTQIMDAIAAAGDKVVLRFATHCMALLELNGEVTLADVEDFATEQGLL